jgi:uncharacterized SAM-binding protein YcdF (DUF218 family)
MLILSKLLPLLVLPPGIFLLLALAGLLFKRRILAWIAIASLWTLSMPAVSTALMQRLEMPYRRIPVGRVQKAEAIVVLSGMLKQVEGAPLGEWGEAAERFEGGIDLFKAGKAPVIVFTAGQLPWQTDCVPEGILLSKKAQLRGVPAQNIRLTSMAANTAEESVATAKLLGVSPGKSKRIILVTSAFHMYRAALLFRAAGFEVEPYPVDFRVTNLKGQSKPLVFELLTYFPNAGAMAVTETAIRELIGRGVYRYGMRLMMPAKR